jgi:hypothetical protein
MRSCAPKPACTRRRPDAEPVPYDVNRDHTRLPACKPSICVSAGWVGPHSIRFPNMARSGVGHLALLHPASEHRALHTSRRSVEEQYSNKLMEYARGRQV